MMGMPGVLTAAEESLVHWLAAGRSNADIGQCVGRSEKTVRNQLTKVYAKLGVANRTEAVALVLRQEFAAKEAARDAEVNAFRDIRPIEVDEAKR